MVMLSYALFAIRIYNTFQSFSDIIIIRIIRKDHHSMNMKLWGTGGKFVINKHLIQLSLR